MNFQIVPLPLNDFKALFGLSDNDLANRGARRLIADANPGFPCRVSLEDAEIGESVILLNYMHQPADSPYRATGPIFVREKAAEASLTPGEIPEAARRRTMSVRAYDSGGMMKNASVVEGGMLEGIIADFFADERVDYLHLHNAGAGCYSCRVDRA
ncbi:MAG: hypothetical protein QOH24_1244 [Verrucomicrobiota bacterium]|jgi:hypothetical protein